MQTVSIVYWWFKINLRVVFLRLLGEAQPYWDLPCCCCCCFVPLFLKKGRKIVFDHSLSIRDQISNDISNRISNPISNYISIRISNRTSNWISNSISNYISNSCISSRIINFISKSGSKRVSNSIGKVISILLSNCIFLKCFLQNWAAFLRLKIFSVLLKNAVCC